MGRHLNLLDCKQIVLTIGSMHHRVRAACGGGSGRMRLPSHGNAATQTAVRILADVKNCLSAQSAVKAAAAQTSAINKGGRPPSPNMHAMQQACTALLRR